MLTESDAGWLTDPYNISSWDGEPLPTIACGRCAYWHRYVGTAEGQCRRKAPEAAAIFAAQMLQAMNKDAEPTEVYRQVLWPEVQNCDWCGEFVARTKDPHEGPE